MDDKWAFYEKDENDNDIELNPLTWDNGSQFQDLSKMIKFFGDKSPIDREKLKKLLIYISQCGSGKSSIILHAGKAIGKTIVVTPFKNLQRQYKDDYFDGDKFVMKENGEKLKVTVFMGRNNFQCEWLHKQYEIQEKIIKANKLEELNGRPPKGYVDDEIVNMYNFDTSCANSMLPCTKSLRLIGDGRRESRVNIACDCKHWVPTPMSSEIINKWKKSPIKSSSSLGLHVDVINGTCSTHDINPILKFAPLNRLEEIQEKLKCSKIEYYDAVGWGKVGVFIRDEKDLNDKDLPNVCPYYRQFYDYIDADVIIMNSAKWLLETQMGRKPKVDLEVFDEGDAWLDSHSFTIEMSRVSIDRIYPVNDKIKKLKADCLAHFDISFNTIERKIKEQKSSNIVNGADFIELFSTIENLYSEQSEIADENDSLLQKVIDMKTIIRCSTISSLSIVRGSKKETKIIKAHIPYPDVILTELFKYSSDNIMLTSGTIHDNNVLSSLFGIKHENYNAAILTGRKDHPGQIKLLQPKEGLQNVTYRNWQNDGFRIHYNIMLNTILDKLKEFIDQVTCEPGKGKIIVLTPAKKYADGIIDRPDVHVDFANFSRNDNSIIETTISDFVNNIDSNVNNIKEIHDDDINIDGNVLRTEKQIIVSTRMIRGTDLRDNKCRGLVILKWPMGDISDGYYQALKKRFGDKMFWTIMQDKAKRDAIQFVSRGLRHDKDWEFFASPDATCFNKIRAIFSMMK